MNKSFTLILLFLPIISFSQKVEKYVLVPKIDSFNIYFSSQSSKLNQSYQNNKKTINQVHELLLFVGAKEIDSICIYSNSVLEFNNNKKNQILSRKRALAIKEFFNKKYPHIPISKFKIKPRVNDVDYLIDLLSSNDSIPDKAILKKLYICKNTRDRKFNVYSDSNFKYIRENIILSKPILSNTIIYYKKRDYNVEYIHTLNYKKDSSFLLNQIIQIDSNQNIYKHTTNINIEEENKKQFDSTHFQVFVPKELQKPKSSFLQLALKTNLLYYLVLAPNIELEMQYNSFSLNFDYIFPWYVNTSKRYCYQLLLGGIEARYWIRNKVNDYGNIPLRGFYLGAYLQRGIFDFQNGEKGTRGDINFLCGISGGYSRSINKNFNLEFSIGLAYFNSNNINYYAYEELLIKKNESKFSYFGPTKAKVSLVWIINNKKY